MAPTPVDYAVNSANTAPCNVTVDDAVSTGDHQIAVQGGNNLAPASLPGPQIEDPDEPGTFIPDPSWTELGRAGLGAGNPALAVWERTAPVGGAQVQRFGQAGSNVHNCYIVSTPDAEIDVFDLLDGANEGAHDIPALDPTIVDGLDIGGVQSRGNTGTEYDTMPGTPAFTRQAHTTGVSPSVLADRTLSDGDPLDAETFVQSGPTWDSWAGWRAVLASTGADPAEGTAELGLDLAVAAAGARDSAGAAAIGLQLDVAAAGARASAGVAALGLQLDVAATGARASAASAAAGVDLAVAAAGARDSLGAADVGLVFTIAAVGARPSIGSAALQLALAIAVAGPASEVIPGTATPGGTSPTLTPGGSSPATLTPGGTSPTLTAS